MVVRQDDVILDSATLICCHVRLGVGKVEGTGGRFGDLNAEIFMIPPMYNCVGDRR